VALAWQLMESLEEIQSILRAQDKLDHLKYHKKDLEAALNVSPHFDANVCVRGVVCAGGDERSPAPLLPTGAHLNESHDQEHDVEESC
jgi:hypothetical protein